MSGRVRLSVQPHGANGERSPDDLGWDCVSMDNPKPNGDDPEAAARREQSSKEARVKALRLIEETAELLRDAVPVEERTAWVTLFAKLLEVDEEGR